MTSKQVDCKDIMQQEGVKGFWRQCILSNRTIKQKVTEKDRPILQYLTDIVLTEHPKDFGFDLAFMFDKNAYF